jgi:hypothetical protein
VFGKKLVRDMITRSAENDTDRRRFLQAAGAVGLGVVGGSMMSGGPAAAVKPKPMPDGNTAGSEAPSDGAILNFALNLEYLEAEFYRYAVFGTGLAGSLTTGTGARGGVTGGSKVPWKTARLYRYAQEIAADEEDHVRFLRTELGEAAVSRPAIDLRNSFTAAARAAGLISSTQTFNPFASEENFLLGAYLFEDVGVTAYKGAAPLISNAVYLEAAAGILAVEAYHAGTIRSALYEKNMGPAAKAISDARDSLDGNISSDEGIVKGSGNANIVPTDANGIAYSRSTGRVLNIVYLNPASVTSGGFFPSGVNGELNQSAGEATGN